MSERKPQPKYATSEHLEEIKLGMATKEDLTTLTRLLFEIEGNTLVPRFATKKDVAPIVEFYNSAVIAARLTGTAGKWGSRMILGIAALLIALGVITGGFKIFVASIFAWAMPTQ